MTVYRAIPKSAKDNVLRVGDWVSPSLAYAKAEGLGIEGGYRVISQEVAAKDLWWDGNSAAEWGFDDGKTSAYRNTKNNRKHLAAVTYDDNGKVIPLSQRFNPKNADPRFAKNKAAIAASINGEEIAPYSADIKTLREAVKQWYEGNLRGREVVNQASGRTVKFAGARKALSTSANSDKLRLFAALEAVIANGEIKSSRAPKDPAVEPTTKAYHWLEADVTLNGKRVTVGVTLREDANGDLYYNHNPIEKAPSTTRSAPSHNDGGGIAESAFSRSMEGAAQAVNLEIVTGRQSVPLSAKQRQHQAAVQAQVDGIVKGWANAPEVIVAHDLNDPRIPESVRRENAKQQSQGAKGAPEGFYYQGKVYLIASQLHDAKAVSRVLFHEVLGHAGLHGRFGAELDGVLKGIATLRALEVKAKLKEYGLSDTPQNRLIAAEEVLAELAQTKPDMGWVKRAVAAIRSWLRQHIPALRGMRLTDGEIIRDYILPARDFIKNGSGVTFGNSLTAFARGKDGKAKWPFDLDNLPPMRVARTFREAREAAKAFQGKPLTNKTTGIVAVVTRNNLDKMLSGSAVNKSESPVVHSMAVANVDSLFERAVLGWSKPDRADDPNIKAIHRYFTPVEIDGRMKMAKLTIKEFYQAGRDQQVYSVEAIDFEDSGGRDWLANAAREDGIPLDKKIPQRGEWVREIAGKPSSPRETLDGFRPEVGRAAEALFNLAQEIENRNRTRDNERPPMFSRADMDSATEEALRKLGLVGDAHKSLFEKVKSLRDGRYKALLKSLSERAEEGIFDGLIGIKRAEKALGITAAEKSGYTSARLATGLADVVHAVLHYGAPQWKNGVMARKDGTRGLLEILGDIGAKDLNNWLGWLGGKRAQLLAAQGRENNLSPADIAELLNLGKGKEALFERVYREYATANEAILDVAEQAGLLDPAQRKAWMADYYVPFYRMEEGEVFHAPSKRSSLSHQSAAIRALKGGKLPTQNLLSNILTAWTTRLDASLKNKALLETVDNLKGSEYLTNETAKFRLADSSQGAAPTDPDIIRVTRAGKNEYYRVHDESLLRAVKFVTQSSNNSPVMRMGRAFKRLLTTGVTASPNFILNNFLRDAVHSWAINRDGFKLGIDSLKGLRGAFKEDSAYRDLMFAGASFQGGYSLGGDADAAAQMIRRALSKKGLDGKQSQAFMDSLIKSPQDLLKKAWEGYRGFGDKVENANRLASYYAAIKAGKSTKQAAFDAKDLMDFSMRGNFQLAVMMTDLWPFLNARLQGLYKLGRAMNGELPTGRGLIAREVAIKGAYIALFSLLLAGMNGDDERYQALKDWDKDNFWHFWFSAEQKEPLRIAKPFEIGLLFGTVPERLFHTLTGTQAVGESSKALRQAVLNTLALDLYPQAVRPAAELWANRDSFFDVPIESLADQNKLKSARYDERTSALGKAAFGGALGDALNLSPKQFDHLVKGYTGTLGGYVLSLSSLIAQAGSDASKPALTAGDIPLISAVYKGDRVSPNRYREDFYDLLKQTQQLQLTINAYRKEGRTEDAQRLTEGNRDLLSRRKALMNTQRQLNQVRERIKNLYRNTRLSPSEKRTELNRLQTLQNEIARRAVRIEKAMGRG